LSTLPNFQADATQVRFQPIHGRYLAAAVGNGVSIIDVETAQTCGYPLKVGQFFYFFLADKSFSLFYVNFPFRE
jgi:hypothetical protein